MGRPEAKKLKESTKKGAKRETKKNAGHVQKSLSRDKAQETQDIVEKEFLAFPDVTADVLNALLYQGEEVVQADALLAGPTESIYQGEGKLRTQYEDLCKYQMSGDRINVMYLIANQSRTDGKMLLRKAGYVGGAYREQYEGKAKGIFPVIELVLYWGSPRWKSSRNLRQLFKRYELTKEDWKYIDELNLHIFEMRHLSREEREQFQSDMRIVLDYLAEGNTYRSDRKIKHKSALIKMIKVLSGDMDIENIEQWVEEQGMKEEDEVMVCELFDQYERKGRIAGLAEGEAQGRIAGLAEGEARGRIAGIAEGEAKGRIAGENRFAKLVQILMDAGRNDDLRRAVSDQKYREWLYREVDMA
ncbi:MAG: Rpn family recombination-promoting nuclease/putative transposase [Lachnospiraceae bacterium]|nr:Rpn family recombination-promoting nuclease/putative transposase [Lachnospiraceae bacterium]